MSSDPPGSSTGGKTSDRGKHLRRPHPRTHERLQNGDFGKFANCLRISQT